MEEFITNVQNEIINPIITLVALAAFVVFVWGVVQFIRGADNEESRKTGQQHMIWGIIGLAIVFGAQAILQIIRSTVGAH
jgi:uncharacterized membrane protein YidH (DUF202 family)